MLDATTRSCTWYVLLFSSYRWAKQVLVSRCKARANLLSPQHASSLSYSKGVTVDKAGEWGIPVVGIEFLVAEAVSRPEDVCDTLCEQLNIFNSFADEPQSVAATPPSSCRTSMVTFASFAPAVELPSASPILREIYTEHKIISARIPSSTLPSPMKVPGSSGTARQSCSPMRIPVEVRKALQDSITNLLWKRPSGGGGASGTHPQGRGGLASEEGLFSNPR